MAEVAMELENYDPMAREVQQDPFPWYAALRERAPVFRHPRTGIFFVSTMQAVNEVLANPRTFSSRISNQQTQAEGDIGEKLAEIAAQGWPPVSTMLTEDPPLQTRYRKTCGRAFSTRRINAFEPRIRALTDEILEGWPQRGKVDVMNTLSIPLPIRVIGSVLPMQDEALQHVKRWSDASIVGLGVRIDDETRLRAARTVIEMQHYWAGEFEDRRRAPQDDVISELAAQDFEDANGAQRKLNIPELISIVQQLMVAGNETTTKAINEMFRLLVENPAECQRLREEPQRRAGAVEEVFRLGSPNQGLFRLATQDSELAGVPVPKGSTLWVMFGSANRDESVFPNPDRFDPGRANMKDHVAFGRGAHFCIGAPLARLELRVLLDRVLESIAEMRFAPGFRFRYEPSYILRGLEELDIEIVRAN